MNRHGRGGLRDQRVVVSPCLRMELRLGAAVVNRSISYEHSRNARDLGDRMTGPNDADQRIIE